MAARPRHTASFKLNPALRRLLEERTAEARPDGCRFYDPRYNRKIRVEMNGGERCDASVLRIAWALAHPAECLTRHDEAVHVCGNTGDPGTAGCCVNPGHLIKADSRLRREVGQHTARRKRAMKEAA